MVAVRHLVLLAALAIVGEAANYDIFKVIDAMTMLTRQDLIDIIKAAEEAFKLGKSRDDVIRMNGPLHYKFRMLRAELRKLSTDEQNVIGKLLAIAREVLDRRVSDVEASNRIMEAFRNGGQGLCARYPRIPARLCILRAPTTATATTPAPAPPQSTKESLQDDKIDLFLHIFESIFKKDNPKRATGDGTPMFYSGAKFMTRLALAK